tara:strand:+ start:139 stop:360 length:222 start_codon:yes stop_codon:yes gene_type:complete
VIPAIVLQKLIPKVLEVILKQFKGIEKIPYLVKYMEDENEADQKIKILEKGFVQLAEEIDALKKELQKWKKNV